MSDIITHFGQATAILFDNSSASQPPSKSTFRKLLGSGPVRCYARQGHYKLEIDRLLYAHEIATGKASRKPWQSVQTTCTHLLITNHHVKHNSFAGVAFGAQLIDGFHLASKSMDALEELLRIRDLVLSLKECEKSWQPLAQMDREAIDAASVMHAALSAADLSELQRVFDAFEDALRTVDQVVSNWVAKRTWV